MDYSEFNIYYQYNYNNEINNPDIAIQYYLAICQLKSILNFDYDKMIQTLKDDGVDFNKVKNIFIRKNTYNSIIELEPLIKNQFENYVYLENSIYLHLLVDDNFCSKESEYKKEYEDYVNKFSILEGNHKNIYSDIKKNINKNLLSENEIFEIINQIEEEKTTKKGDLNSLIL